MSGGAGANGDNCGEAAAAARAAAMQNSDSSDDSDAGQADADGRAWLSMAPGEHRLLDRGPFHRVGRLLVPRTRIHNRSRDPSLCPSLCPSSYAL